VLAARRCETARSLQRFLADSYRSESNVERAGEDDDDL
jgi:hypothetical protein